MVWSDSNWKRLCSSSINHKLLINCFLTERVTWTHITILTLLPKLISDNGWKIQRDCVSQKKKKRHMQMHKPFQPVITWSHPDPPSDINILIIEPTETPTIAKSPNVRNVSLLGSFGRTLETSWDNLSHDFSKTVPFSWNLHPESTGKYVIIGWHQLLFFHTNYVSRKRKKRRKTLLRQVLKKLRWQKRSTQQGRRGRSQKEQRKVNRKQEKKARLPFFSLLFGWWKRARWSWWSVMLTCWTGLTSLVRWR